MDKRYALEIYEPKSADDVLAYYEADYPFGSIGEGDILRPLDDSAAPLGSLRVLTVEHLLWPSSAGTKHKICIYTERLDTSIRSRTSGFHLTLKDRWMISNQLHTLELLHPPGMESEHICHTREALESGFEYGYDSMIEYFSPTFTYAECMEVLDILEMFWIIEREYDNLSDKSGVEQYDGEVRFHGFDGNNEGQQLRFARYFCEGTDRFGDVGKRAGMNSHSPTLARYRAMVEVYKKMKAEKIRTLTNEFTKAQIIEILEGWRKEKQRLDEAYEAWKKRTGK